MPILPTVPVPPNTLHKATTTPTTMPASSSSGTTIPSKSSLRDYRKPTKPKLSASAAVSASNSNHTTPKTTATEYARALSGSEVSITAVVGPKTVPALPKQQPPIVSMFPVPQASKPLVSQASKPPAPMVPQ